MKQSVKLFAAFILFAISLQSLSANNTITNAPANEVQEFVREAQQTAHLIARLIPMVERYRPRTRAEYSFKKGYLSALRKGEALAKRVVATQGRMTRVQYRQFQNQLQVLNRELIVLGGRNTSDGPAACMLECDAAYPGWGGGNGWNRFWCKLACLKIKVGKDGASIGE